MSSAVHQKNQPQVAIAWVRNAGDLNVQFLSSFEGIRLYAKDAYDLRVGENLPYYLNAKEALKWMSEHPGAPCQIDTRTLVRFGINP